MNPFFNKANLIFVLMTFFVSNSNVFGQELEQDSLDYVHTPSNYSVYRASQTKYFDLIHTKLQVSFDWEKEELIGSAFLTLTPYFYEQQHLTLDAKSMIINSVSLSNGKKAKQSLEYQYEGNKLEISLDKLYSRKDTLKLNIEYTSRPNEIDVAGSESITNDKGLYFINSDQSEPNKPQQIWTQGETQSSSVWFPTIDTPNERSTQELIITVDDSFNTISNGILISQSSNTDGMRTDHWVMNQSHAPYLFMMAIGKYASVHDEWNGIPLTYHLEPEYEPYAKDIFGRTPEMMQYFSELLDYPFPWPKYDQVVVRDFVSGAMENTSASVFMEQVQITKKELKDYNWDDIIAHELFHQWFGNLVTCESWSNLTLNEGFASYGEYLWDEYKYGVDEANYNLMLSIEDYFIESEEEPKELIRYHYAHREDMFDRHSYNKGAAVLHMLRNYVGNEAFFAGLHKYLVDNAYDDVELADLRLAFEAISGEDLNWFFDQWFHFAGHPEILVEQEYKNDTLTLMIQQIQSEQFPVYKLPVFIEVWSEGKSNLYPVIINDAYETYQFYVPSRPELVIFDSERQLLANIYHPKSEEEFLFQFLNATTFTSRFEVINSIEKITNKKILSQILYEALEDPHYIIIQKALQYMIDNEIKSKKYETLIQKALMHESSEVRSYALAYLANEDFERNKTKVKAALDDESYIVQSVAITYWHKNNQTISKEKLSYFSEEKNIQIVTAMAEYYTNMTDEDSFLWFENKIKQLKDDGLYYLIQSYSNKLLTSSVNQKKNAVSIYEDLAKNNKDYYVRLAAYQGLLLMTEIEGVDEKLIEIKKVEKDVRLLDLYEQF